MKEEYNSLLENHTWDEVEAPSGRKILRGKWVYKIKRGSSGEITRFKARWDVRGFEQQEGVDFNENFASVVKPMSFKTVYAIASARRYYIEQMDIKTAYLYGYVEEVIYVELPKGMSRSKLVCRLRKALYGLKQGARVWDKTLSARLLRMGFEPLTADHSVFIRGNIIIIIYVDDLLLVGPDLDDLNSVKKELFKSFQMSDLGASTFYLGMSVTRDREAQVLSLSQETYQEDSANYGYAGF